MASAIFVICASALFLQSILTQCKGHPGVQHAAIPEGLPNSVAYAPTLEPTPQPIPENAAVFNGGGFKVTSYSNAGPTGLTVHSDNLAVEGPLAVTGKLPFLGVVAVEGPLPAVGQGTVAYECGNGNVGIVGEGIQGDGFGLAAGLTGLGYNGVGYTSVGSGLPVGYY